jgi:hypothetical protein
MRILKASVHALVGYLSAAGLNFLKSRGGAKFLTGPQLAIIDFARPSGRRNLGVCLHSEFTAQVTSGSHTRLNDLPEIASTPSRGLLLPSGDLRETRV